MPDPDGPARTITRARTAHSLETPAPQDWTGRCGARVLLALSLVLAWFLVYLLVLSSFEQGHAQNGLYGELRTQLAAGTAPTGAPVRAGAPVALLAIPRAGLEGEVVVVLGWVGGLRELHADEGFLRSTSPDLLRYALTEAFTAAQEGPRT